MLNRSEQEQLEQVEKIKKDLIERIHNYFIKEFMREQDKEKNIVVKFKRNEESITYLLESNRLRKFVTTDQIQVGNNNSTGLPIEGFLSGKYLPIHLLSLFEKIEESKLGFDLLELMQEQVNQMSGLWWLLWFNPLRPLIFELNEFLNQYDKTKFKQDESTRIEKIIMELKESISALLEQVTKLTKEIAFLKEEVTTLRDALEDKDGEALQRIKLYEEEIATHRENLATSEKEKEELARALSDLLVNYKKIQPLIMQGVAERNNAILRNIEDRQVLIGNDIKKISSKVSECKKNYSTETPEESIAKIRRFNQQHDKFKPKGKQQHKQKNRQENTPHSQSYSQRFSLMRQVSIGSKKDEGPSTSKSHGNSP